jgi:hypothetical protein
MFLLGTAQQQLQIAPSVGAPPGMLDKLEACWDCDETGDATVTRADSHNAHDLTILAGIVDTPGLVGNALKFTSNDWAYTAGGWPTGAGSFAMGMFVHIDAHTTNAIICQRGGTSSNDLVVSWHVWINDAGAAYFCISLDGTMNDWDGTTVSVPAGSFPAGETHYLYWHYDSVTGEMAISVDNGALSTATLSNTFYSASREALRFGHMASSYPHDLVGWLDCIHYYNEPLSASERAWEYNGGAGRAYGDFTGTHSTLLNDLVAWYSLDETTGTRNDSHGTNHLTDVNDPGYEAGKQGNAAVYAAGQNEYLVAAAPHDLYGGDRDFSFATWYKPPTGVPDVAIAHCGIGAGANVSDYVLYTVSGQVRIYAGVGGTWYYAAGPTLVAGTMYCIYFQYVAATKTLSIRVDDGPLADTVLPAAPNKIGGSFYLGTYFGYSDTTGSQDETAFWRRTLTDAEYLEFWNSGAGVSYTDLGTPPVLEPLDIEGLTVLLDARDPGVTANQWDDLSGQNNHYTSPDAGTFPTIAAGAARFDNDYVQGVDLSALTEGEAFFLYKVDSEAGADAVKGGCSFGNVLSGFPNDHWPWGGDGQIYSAFGSTTRKTCGNPTPPLTDYTVLNFHSAQNDWGLRVNGTPLYATTSNTVSFTSNTIIGKSAGSYYVIGYFKAIVLFNRKLTTHERAHVEAYLQALI